VSGFFCRTVTLFRLLEIISGRRFTDAYDRCHYQPRSLEGHAAFRGNPIVNGR
jgi:hypothetical protein